MIKDGKIIKYLLEWTEHYFRSRDSFHKNIVSMVWKEGVLEIKFKDRKERIAIYPLIDGIENELKEGSSIITLNSRSNVDALYDNWPKFSRIANLKIYFINPFSTTEKKWIVSPAVHAKICDESSLKTGLISMFGTVEPITVEILEEKL